MLTFKSIEASLVPVEMIFLIPFAGITRSRFKGFDLSL
jgi:hypothetical protein